MQISRFIQIVVFVTALDFSFWAALRFLDFFTLAFLILLLLYLLECAGEFRLCGGDHGLCPLDSHKPLKRLDRNFKCLVSLGTYDRGGLLSHDFQQTKCRRPNKNKKTYDFELSLILLSLYKYSAANCIFVALKPFSSGYIK